MAIFLDPESEELNAFEPIAMLSSPSLKLRPAWYPKNVFLSEPSPNLYPAL